MRVLKFGGTSVGSARAVSRVVEIVRGRLQYRPVVVVSALSGVTDLLYRIAASSPETLPELVRALQERHFSLVRELFPSDNARCIHLKKVLQEFIDGICATMRQGTLSDRDRAAVISCGELMSSKIVCEALCSAGIRTEWVDAREMMIATGDPLSSEPLTEEIDERAPRVIGEAFGGTAPAPAACNPGAPAPAASGKAAVEAVITQGFICSSPSGKAAVLGRGGSDYSASLIGCALDADAVEIWTDVDGVRTADPRRVPTTRCLECISYEQAAEMAHFGAKVLHPLTLEPAKVHNTPVYVLNTHNPSGGHTVVLCAEKAHNEVKSVSYKEKILVITMMSRQPMDSSAFLKKVFDVFGRCRIPLDLVSTNNACLSVTVDASCKNLDAAIRELETFADVAVDTDKSQISAIGSSAVGMNGILAMTFAPLRDCKIYMVSPGASFVNISFVVDRTSLDQVLCQTHKFLIER